MLFINRRLALWAVVACAISCSGSKPAPQDDAGVSCDAGACDGHCVDVRFDDAHCGSCGTACEADAACAGGMCLPRSCGTLTCGQSQVCQASMCVDRACFGVLCAAGQACAGGQCYARNCAGQQCRPTEVCVDAQCEDAVCVGVLCPGGLRCAAGVCITDTCGDGVNNGLETDTDCGGPCAACLPGSHCSTPFDCTTLSCDGGACLNASCSDRVRNGNEVDLDCGGSCPPCADGRRCQSAAGCQSAVCAQGVCSAPTCSDLTRNGDETDIDCGGSCAARCPGAAGCQSMADCQSGLCIAGQCAPPTCLNGMTDGTETDLDCGGVCPGCATNKHCGSSRDCVSLVCDLSAGMAAARCQAPTCFDLVRNGTESDVDCGQSCAPCVDGQRCSLGADCVSRSCASLRCAAPTCTDAISNGVESDVDCGGDGGCVRCGPNGRCAVGADCASASCDGGYCTRLPLLGPPQQLAAGTGPLSLTAADIDLDGLSDLAITNEGSFDVTLFYSEADGGLSTPTNLQIGAGGNVLAPANVTFADVTGDGKLDAITARATTRGYCEFGTKPGWADCVVTYFKGVGPRQFLGGVDTLVTGASASGCGYRLATGHFHPSSRLDVAIGDEGRGIYCQGPDVGGGFAVTLDAGVAVTLTGPLPQSGPWVVSADVNLDGKSDVIGHSAGYSKVRVFLGTGNGGFLAPIDVGVAAGGGMLSVGLLDGDGNPDVAVASKSAGTVGVALGLGDGNFLSPTSYSVASPDGVVIGDMTGDGVADLVVGGVGVALLRGRGNGTFEAPEVYAAQLGDVGDVALGDFNRDGKLDVAAIANGKVYLLFNLRP